MSGKTSAKADSSTVAVHSLSNANMNNDDLSTVKNMNVHVSGKIEEIAPHDEDNDMDTSESQSTGKKHLSDKANDAYTTAKQKASEIGETAKNKANELGQSASENWEAAKIKGASVNQVAKKKLMDYSSGKESTSLGQSKPKTSNDKASLKETASDDLSESRVQGDQQPNRTITQTATEYAVAAKGKAAALVQQAHDKIQEQSGSDVPLREQAQQKASEWATQIESAVGQAKEKAYEYAGYAKDKANQQSETEGNDQNDSQVGEAVKRTGHDLVDASKKVKDSASQAVENVENNMTKTNSSSSPSLLSKASAAVSNTLSSAAGMLGLSSSGKTVVESTYESTEKITDKDEASSTATVQKTETWTEKKDNQPTTSRSKDSQYKTKLRSDNKL